MAVTFPLVKPLRVQSPHEMRRGVIFLQAFQHSVPCATAPSSAMKPVGQTEVQMRGKPAKDIAAAANGSVPMNR
jgi:hypothetical protein